MSGTQRAPDARVFYLGQPPSSNLRENVSVTACALFFYEVAPKLAFTDLESSADALLSKGSCQDALNVSCVSDWTKQAEDIARDSDDADFTCERLADELRAHPPAACTVAKKSWGNVVARCKFLIDSIGVNVANPQDSD